MLSAMTEHLCSGDGEIRTRVRKIRLSKIYERSLLIFVITGISAG